MVTGEYDAKAKEKALSSFDSYLEREVEGEVQNKHVNCSYNKELHAVVLSGRAEIITEIGVAKEINGAD